MMFSYSNAEFNMNDLKAELFLNKVHLLNKVIHNLIIFSFYENNVS